MQKTITPNTKGAQMRWLFLVLMFGVIDFAQAQQIILTQETKTEQDRLDRIYEATVRVSVSGGTGTGTIYKEDNDYYYILTNQHVVGNSKSAGLEFTKNHYPSPRYQGVVTRSRNANGIDVAEVRIPKASLPDGIDLPVIPLAQVGDAPRELFLVTSGCQAGERPSIQLTITTDSKTGLIYYLPTSRPGRSGSSLVSRDGTKIYGLVAWMTGGKDSQGLAMTTEAIRGFLQGTASEVADIDLPEGAVEIPLAPDFYVGEDIKLISSAIDNCPADSCLDGKCPWDYQYASTNPQDNPWMKRFGGPQQPVDPQPRPAEPQPDPQPDSPWNPNRPKQDLPQEPQQPQPQPERDRLLGDRLEFGKLFERFDKLEPRLERLDRIEPKIDELVEKAPSEEDETRNRKLFDRLERIPDKLIGPDDLNQFAEKQSDSILTKAKNLVWMLLTPFLWVWNIAVILLVVWGLNTVLTPFFGPNWLGIFIVWIVGMVKSIFSAIGQGISAIRTATSVPAAPAEPVKKARKPRTPKVQKEE